MKYAMDPILIFDGDCALCSRSVRFILRHECKPGVVSFAPCRSDAARLLLSDHGLHPDAITSLVFIEDGRAHTRSAAVLRLCRYLERPWRWGRLFRLVPGPVLDVPYRLIARNRYRLFGKGNRCGTDNTVADRMIEAHKKTPARTGARE